MTKTRKVVARRPVPSRALWIVNGVEIDPAVLALVDEYDEMRDNVNNQGGPLGLVERRGDTYADFVCVVTSSPKKGRVATSHDKTSGLWHLLADVAVTEDIESPIWQLWQQGTRHHWSWPCPHCNEYFVPRFDLMRYSMKASPLEAGREAFLECPSCHGVVEDHHKTEMNARGRYVAPGQSIDKAGVVHGAPHESKSISYWCSWRWRRRSCRSVERISRAGRSAAIGHDDAMVQQAVNAGFGELYSPGGGEVPEWMEIKEKSRVSPYQRGTVPEDVMYLTMTCDVQRSSIPWVIRGWGARATSWLINYGYLRGDTAEEEIWNALADLVTTPITMTSPSSSASLTAASVPARPTRCRSIASMNSCWQPSAACERRRDRQPRCAPPLIFSTRSKSVARMASAYAKYGLDLVRLDTDHWKSWVHERLRWPEDHVGGWHIFRGVDDDYCHQLVSEARLKKPSGKVEWVQRSRDNHFFDAEAMQAAAGYLLNVQRIPLQNKPKPIKDGTGTQPETPVEVTISPEAQPAPPPVVQRARGVRRIIRSNYLGA